jgi:kinesin family protein 2/24
VTCFAYGQTGSGKTFTMEGVQEQACHDLFQGAEIMFDETGRQYGFKISYYEIYGGKIYDLLNNHKKLELLEDKSGKFHVAGI